MDGFTKENDRNNIKKIIYSKKNQGNLESKKYIKKQNIPSLNDIFFNMAKFNENNDQLSENLEKNRENIINFLKILTSKNNIINNINNNTLPIDLNINNLNEYFILFHQFLSFLSDNNIIKLSIKKIEIDFFLNELMKRKNNIDFINLVQCQSEPNTVKRKRKFNLDNNNISETSSNNFSPSKILTNSLPLNARNRNINNNKNFFTHSQDFSYFSKGISNKDIKDKNINSTNHGKNNRKCIRKELMFEPNNSKTYKPVFIIENNKSKISRNNNSKNNTGIKVNKTKFITNKEQLIMVKIKELNNETQKFKEDHKKIMDIKDEYEKLQKELMRDIENFNIKKKNFEDYMQKEREKLQKERKKFIEETKFLNDLKQENKTLNINDKINQKKMQTLNEKIAELEGYIKNNKIKVKTNIKSKTDKKKDMTSYMTENNINTTKTKKNNYYYIKKNYCDDIEGNSTTLINNNVTLKKEASKLFNQASPCSKYSSKALSKNNSINKNNFNILKNSINFYNNYSKNIVATTRNKDKINYKSNSINNLSNLNQNRFNIRVKKNFNKNMKVKLFNDTNSIRDFQCSIMKNNDIQKVKLPNSNSTQVVKNKNINSFEAKNINSDKESMEIINNMNCVNNINNIITNSVNSINTNLFSSNHETKLKSIFDEDNNFDFIIPEKYLDNSKYKLLETQEEENGQIIKIYSNNKKEVIFKSGVKKEIFDNGNYKLVYFPNGDKKQCFKNIGKMVYYFNDSKTVQTSYKNGLNIFKFSNNQIEKHFTDGSKLIILPDGTKRMMSEKKTSNIIDISSAEDEVISNLNLNNGKDINDKESILSDLILNFQNEI